MQKPSSLPPLILVDGSSYLFRAFHALPPLTNSKGMPTGAIYGVLNMLRKLVKDYEPSHIAVIFDSKSKNFRHQLYSAYKANRAVMPDDLQVQIQPLFAAIRALGLPLIVVEGVEADDIIGTLAAYAQKQKMDVLISTGDKDLAQLVNPHVTLMNTMSQQILDEAGVQAKFGVLPAQIIDYLALTGDSVDNIPGVPNVGPKTAANWLGQYHSLDNLLKNADKVPGKAGENLRNNIEQVLLGRQLVTVKMDVALPQTLAELMPAAPDNEKLTELFTELEFKTWLQDLPQHAEPPPQVEYETILTREEFQHWLKKLAQSNVIAITLKTTSMDAMRAELVGIALAISSGHAAYVPLTHDYAGAPSQLQREWVLQQLAAVLNDPQKIIVGQNLKYDLKIFAHYGVTLRGVLWDSLLASYILDSGTTRHDLNTLALKYLSFRTRTYEEIAGKGAKQLTFNQVPIDKAAVFAAENADVAMRLYKTLNRDLQAQSELLTVFNTIEMPLMPILANMEQTGVLIDAAKLAQHSQILGERLQALEQEVYALSGEEFNLNSAKQLQVILYEKLKLPVLKKTPTGQPSTGEDVLQELALEYPIPRLILIYRSLSKLKSTYTDSLPEAVNPRTGRVHTSYQQAITSTGRLSSSDPNLQNIPIRSEEGRKIRQTFIAPPGYKILAADYSQVELRIMAHLAQDPGLLQAFSQGLDVHRATAAEVYGISLEMVSADQRRNAKAINFGLMYGMSSFGLSQQLGISRDEAQRHIDIYFQKYPRVHEYMEQARALAAKQGYVKTLLGRRVQVPDIKASNQFRRQASERQAINAPLQGTAADIIKMAMICIDSWLFQHKSSARMIMQVHDELVFEVPEAEIELISREVRRCMEQVIALSVPLVVDIGIGDNWDEAH
jgi:DNA polymerase I